MEQPQLRSRVVSNESNELDSIPSGPELEVLGTEPQQLIRHKRKVEWDSLFWMFAAFACLYFTNFASTLLFNDSIKHGWLGVGILCLCVSCGCLVYALIYHPRLSSINWNEEAPVLVAMATINCLVGGICFTVAVWPVWKFYTLIILPVLIMGFVSTVSLFNL